MVYYVQFLAGKSIIGYLHNLSPMKVSKNDNEYFDVNVQMKEKTMRAICFSPDKMKPSSPVKICNYTIKRNQYSQEDEIHLSKRTRLSDPDASEVNFNIVEQKVDEELTFSSVSDVVGNKESIGQVNISGRVSFQGLPETVKSNGKTRMKQEAILTDESGSIRIVFWQSDIEIIQSGSSYELTRAIVKNYDGENYITINRQTVLRNSTVKVARDDDERVQVQNISKGFLPADGLEKVTSYLCCNKCNASLLQNDNRKVGKCSNCGCGELKSKCKKLMIAKALFIKDKKKVTLTIFDEKLAELYTIYRKQTNSTQLYSQLDEDEIMEFLLCVEAVVCYNKRLNVISIESKDN